MEFIIISYKPWLFLCPCSIFYSFAFQLCSSITLLKILYFYLVYFVYLSATVSNSMLTDEKRQVQERIKTTILVTDQNSSEVLLRYMVSFIYRSRSPNNPKQVHCKAAQNAVPVHWCHDRIIWHRNCWTLDGNHAQPSSNKWNER